MPLEDDLIWICQWFFCQEGLLSDRTKDWYGGHVLKIGGLDNPGWAIKIGLKETSLENKAFDKLWIERSEDDWLAARVEDHFFRIACGLNNLEEGIKIFIKWVKTHNDHMVVQFYSIDHQKERIVRTSINLKNDLVWIRKWLCFQEGVHYDGTDNWDGANDVRINRLNNTGWSVSIGLKDTVLENEVFADLWIKRSENDWLSYCLKNQIFRISCGLNNMGEGIQNFVKWAKMHEERVVD